MNLFRVHCCASRPDGYTPYLSLRCFGFDGLHLDVSPLETMGEPTPLQRFLSFEQAYQVLCGKSVVLQERSGAVALKARSDYLFVGYEGGPEDETWRRKLWLAEFAVAYNMACPLPLA